MDDKSTYLLSEVVKEFWDEWDMRITERIVSYTLKKHGFRRAAVRRDAAQRSEEIRLAWIGTMGGYNKKQVVFLDESAGNQKAGWRKYGWSRQGYTPVTQELLKRDKRWSILPAYTVDGILLITKIIQGSIPQEIFNDWIRTLPLCNPYPGPRSVLILDNCVVHKHVSVQQMCDEAGIILELLPPYSPDFNPIEYMFNTLKNSGCDASGSQSFEHCGYHDTILNS